MKRNLFIALASVGSLVLVLGVGMTTALACSGGAKAHSMRGHGGPGMGFLAKLDLDETQQAQVRELRAEMRQNARGQHTQMRKLHERMAEQWSADVVDVDAVRQIEQQMDVVRDQKRTARLDFMLSVHAILTPDQRALMAESPRLS